jgi:dihydroorotase
VETLHYSKFDFSNDRDTFVEIFKIIKSVPNSYLIRNATLVSKGYTHHLSKIDILITDGVIKTIGTKIVAEAKEIKGEQLFVTSGWFDLRVHLSDPGNEHKDNLSNLLESAAAGGFTAICTLPNSEPAVHGKSTVNYLQKQAEPLLTTLFPTGVLSAADDEENLAELYDMHLAGAAAFTNGARKVSNGLLKKALLYTKPFKTKILVQPIDKSLHQNGMVNESENTIHTGLKTSPSLAEYIAVREQLEIAKYCDSPMHFSGISCKESVELISEAKKKGQNVTCDVPIFNLCFTDSEVLNFDENFKVFPVLRSEKDRKALIKGLLNGTIDAICSNHYPQNIEGKEVEFDYAEEGALSLQLVYSWYLKHLAKEIDFETFVARLTTDARNVLGVETSSIAEGEIANISVFDAALDWKLDNATNKSTSRNSHEYNKILRGKAIAVFNDKKVNLF